MSKAYDTAPAIGTEPSRSTGSRRAAVVGVLLLALFGVLFTTGLLPRLRRE